MSRLVSSQASAKPAPAPNLPDLIRHELNPEPAEQFDPATHETDPATGGPIFNADGTMRRKRGRKPGQVYGRPGDELAGGGEPATEPAISPAAAMAEAKLFSAFTFSTCEGLFGPAWEPEPAERDQITEALAEYIRTVGGFGIPPWATVALAFGSYAARRTQIGRMIGLSPAAIGPAPEGEPRPIDELSGMGPMAVPGVGGSLSDPALTAPVARGTGGGMKPPPVARDAA